MAQELRQRRMGDNHANERERVKQLDLHPSEVGLTAPKMLQASPQEHGYMMKLHIPQFYSILPRFFQKLICRIWFLSFLAPNWERRYLILLGSFLYKFIDDTNPSRPPKGSPIPVDSIDVNFLEGTALDSDNVAGGVELPPDCSSVFVVSNLRKKQYFAAQNREQAMTWVNSLREARQEAITRSMGHAPDDSYPNSWGYFDNRGRSLMQRKERIRTKLEQSSLREMEMSNLAEGGPTPRGYYG